MSERRGVAFGNIPSVTVTRTGPGRIAPTPPLGFTRRGNIDLDPEDAITALSGVTPGYRNATRRADPSPGLARDVRDAITAVNPSLSVTITSAGQNAQTGRIGSTRHNTRDGAGPAIDVVVSKPDGSRVTMDTDPRTSAAIAEAMGAVGITGIGHYDWGFHFDRARPGKWGPDRTSATLNADFSTAFDRGQGLTLADIAEKHGTAEDLAALYSTPTPRARPDPDAPRTMGELRSIDPVPVARPDPGLPQTPDMGVNAATAAPMQTFEQARQALGGAPTAAPAPTGMDLGSRSIVAGRSPRSFNDPMGAAMASTAPSSLRSMDDPLGDAMMASPPSTVTSRPSPAAELGTYGSSAPSAPSRDFGAAFNMASPRGLEGVNAIAAAPAPPSMSQAQSLGQMMDVADFPGMAPSPVADPMAEALRGTPAPASPRDRPDPAPAAPNMSLADFGAGMPRGSPTLSLGPTEQMAQMMGMAGMPAPAAPVTAPAAPRERPSPPPTIAPATPRARPEMAPMVAPATPRARPEDVVEEVAAVAPPTVAPVDAPPETPPPAQMAPPPQPQPRPQPQPQPQPVAQPQPQPVAPQPAPAPAPQQRSVPTVAGLAPSINQSIQSAGLPAPPGNMAYGYSPATGIATVSPNAPESVQIAATGPGLFGAINRDTESQIGSRVEDTLGNFALGMTGARVGGFAGGMLGGLVGGPVGAALGAGVGALGGRAIARNAPSMDATGIPGVSPQDAITAGGRQPVSNLGPGVSYSDQRGLAGFFGNLFGRDDEETATAGTSRGISGGFGGFGGFGGGPAGGPGSTTESGSLGGMF